MRAFSYAWSHSLPVTWQRWRLHHSIGHIRKPHATRKPHGCMFYRTEVIADRSFTLREYEFSTFFVHVTLTLTRWPSYTTWPVFPADRPEPDVQIWTFYVKVFESYRLTDRQTDRQTDTTEIIYHAASRVVNNIIVICHPVT